MVQGHCRVSPPCPDWQCVVQVLRMGAPVTALSLSPATDMLATCHVNRRGIYLWSNAAVYGSAADIRPSTAPVDARMPVLAAGGPSVQPLLNIPVDTGALHQPILALHRFRQRASPRAADHDEACCASVRGCCNFILKLQYGWNLIYLCRPCGPGCDRAGGASRGACRRRSVLQRRRGGNACGRPPPASGRRGACGR